MDVGVYELSELTNEQVKEKVRKRESFKIKGIEALKFNETVGTVEKLSLIHISEPTRPY